MSVEDTSPKIYNCNGSVTSFAAGFIDIESFGVSALQSEHVTVIHWDDILEIEEELTITTEYTISGTNIVTVATYPTNDKIAILPEYDYLQSFEFTASPFLDTGSLEIATDKNTLNTQKNKDLVSRGLVAQITDDVVSLEIPRKTDRASKYLGFDSDGIPIALEDSNPQITQNTADIATNTADIATNVTNIATNVSDIAALEDFVDPVLRTVELTDGRVAIRELTSENITVSDDYVIAKTDTFSANRYASQFLITVKDSGVTSSYIAIVACSNRAVTKTHKNTTIKFIGKSDPITTKGLKSLKLLCGVTATAGYTLIAELEVDTSLDINVQKLGNIAGNDTGFSLLSATTTNNNKTPDGTLVDVTLEAGEELSFEDDTINPFQAKKLSDDVLFGTAYWPEIPKQGSSLSLNFPTSLVIRDGTGASISISTGTISNENFHCQIITFRLNNVAAFASLNSGPLVIEANGNGGFLKIT